MGHVIGIGGVLLYVFVIMPWQLRRYEKEHEQEMERLRKKYEYRGKGIY